LLWLAYGIGRNNSQSLEAGFLRGLFVIEAPGPTVMPGSEPVTNGG
jgi:hypothetical protein